MDRAEVVLVAARMAKVVVEAVIMLIIKVDDDYEREGHDQIGCSR